MIKIKSIFFKLTSSIFIINLLLISFKLNSSALLIPTTTNNVNITSLNESLSSSFDNDNSTTTTASTITTTTTLTTVNSSDHLIKGQSISSSTISNYNTTNKINQLNVTTIVNINTNVNNVFLNSRIFNDFNSNFKTKSFRINNNISSNNNMNNFTSKQVITQSKTNLTQLPQLSISTTIMPRSESILATTIFIANLSSTIATTTSTTSVKPYRTQIYLTHFKLNNISLNIGNQVFTINYVLRTNLSKLAQLDEALFLNISINCSAEKQQTWFSFISNQIVTSNYTNLNVNIPFKQTASPKSGSLVTCSAQAFNQFNLLTSYAYLLIDPSQATSLNLMKRNETTLELAWNNPLYFYDSLELECKLNYDENDEQYSLLNLAQVLTKFSKKIYQPLTSYTLSNLLPGSNYSCFIITNRNAFNNTISSKIESKETSQITDLSQPLILNQVTNSNGSFEIEFNPPFGCYDYFSINLIDLNLKTKTNNTIFSKNFSFQFTTNLKYSHPEPILLPGKTYEIRCSIYRSTNKYVKYRQEKHVKCSDSFLIKPEPVKNINVFTLSNSSINVTWERPLSVESSKKFLINLFTSNSSEVKTFLYSNLNWIVHSGLKSSTSYLIQVLACSSKPDSNNECESSSEALNKTFNFDQEKILNLNKTFIGSDLQVDWDIDMHDISKFSVKLFESKLNLTNDCYLYFENETNYDKQQSCQWDFKCSLNKCSLNVNSLKANNFYNLTLTPISISNNFEFNPSKFYFKTAPSLPEKDQQTKINYVVQSKIESSPVICLDVPQIDQSNGQIIASYLFLIKLGRLEDFNQTKMFKLEQTRDQENLKLILEASSQCSNETDFMEPCLLKNYTINQIDSNRKTFFIGKMTESIDNILNSSVTEETRLFENITTNLVEPSSLYQLFFVFKIGDIDDNSNDHLLYFATFPTEPIQTKSTNYNLIITGQNRDGVALWIIIVICIVSSVFLIGVIITLVLLTLIKYKPSKFHKAAQIVAAGQQQNNRFNGICQSMPHGFVSANMRSKFDRPDEYLGNCDFIIPGEFSKQDMTNIWLVKHANGDLILDEEYRNLPDFRDFKTCNASQLIKNEYKNRFLDIKAYDDSRVILDVNLNNYLNIKKNDQTKANDKSLLSPSVSSSNSDLSGENQSIDQNSDISSQPFGDYINANFVQGYLHEKKFIATQGPKKETINDFWRMIYQYRVSAIVMLTKLVEKGVERCTQYWPDKLNITETFGDFEITLKDQQKYGDYIKRTFDLVYVNSMTSSSYASTSTPASLFNRKILTVNQYYYPEWPDKDTPSTDPISILHLIRDVNQNHLAYQYPIVVHCSAGVGRTGTYITLDAMIEKINTESKIDIFGFISKIRERRQYLVQTSKQYIFIHEALYEYCLYGFTDIEVSHLVAHYKNLKEPYSIGSNMEKTGIQAEYEKLCTAFYPNCQAREAFSNENKSRNRNLNNICYDDNRIRLSTLNGSSYINATMIRGFEISNDLIITQDPMQNTLFEFWKMIFEYDCNIIVALNKDYELEKESVYWPNEQEPIRNCEFDDVKYVIQLIKPMKYSQNANGEDFTSNDFITKREFEIIEHKYSGTTKMNVTHFLYNEFWPEEQTPKDRSAFIGLVGQVQKTAAKFERSKIVVHAYGGGSNCSVFCALNILLYQFKNDQYVDVCRTVKKLKTQRPYMIETFNQYEFLYQCLVDFVDMFGIYSQSCDSFNSRTSLNESHYLEYSQKHDSNESAKLKQIKLAFK